MFTIYGKTGSENIDVKIECSYTIREDVNASYVTAALYYKRNSSGTTSGMGTFSLSIYGQFSYEPNTTNSTTKYLTITEDDWVLAIQHSRYVMHNDAGGGAVTISATGSIPDTPLTSTTIGGRYALETISKAAVIDSLSCDTKYFNGEMTYKYTPKNADYYTRCNIYLNLDGTYTAVKSINLGQKTESQQTATVTLSENELSIIYSKLPNSTKGKLRFTLSTYSDSGYSSQVGDANYKEIDLLIPNISATQPTATMTLSPVNTLADPFDKLYIQGMTKVQAAFKNGAGRYGASVTSYNVTVDGKSYGPPYTSEYIATSGSITVQGIVTDTRGFSRTYTQVINFIEYAEPALLPASGENKIICARCDKDGNISDSGTYLKIKAMRSYYAVASDGVQNNYCAIRFRYREESDTNFSDWITILGRTTLASNTADTAPLSNVVSSTETAYVVQIGVIDDLGNSNTIQFIVPTDFVIVDMPDDYKGKRIGIFRYVQDTDEDGLYVGLPIFGGSIDSLKRGSPLLTTEGESIDLDDVKTPGCYYSPSASHSKYIENSPYREGGFGLEVRELQSANCIRQTIYYDGTTWVRHWNGEEWSVWARYLNSDTDPFPQFPAVDYVIEAGTKNGWTYKKWKGGTYEMYGHFDVKTTESFTTKGNLYATERFKIETPFSVQTAVVTGTATEWFIPIMGELDNGDIYVRLFCPYAFPVGKPASLGLHVTGEY